MFSESKKSNQKIKKNGGSNNEHRINFGRKSNLRGFSGAAREKRNRSGDRRWKSHSDRRKSLGQEKSPWLQPGAECVGHAIKHINSIAHNVQKVKKISTFRVLSNNIKNIKVILLNTEFQNKMEEYESICDYSSISKEYQIFKDKLDNLEVKEPKELIKIKLTDLLEYLQVKKYSGSEKPGLIPLYGATIKHLPTQFIDNYSYDTSEAKDEITRENGIIMINNTGNGGAGLCFIHKGKFAILNTVTVFKMKQILVVRH